ncbi:hypothetical protein C8R47DRAFT_920239, partial [Mycena vitilis]
KQHATKYYFVLSKEASAFVAAMFEALYPEYYVQYQEDFKRGVWLTEDEGPFLERVVVSKLQVGIHIDGLDKGPAATFPSGWFTGGCMVFPDTRSKLEYRAGDLCIGLACDLYHAVEHWEPAAPPLDLQKQNITPGRTSNVFFSSGKASEALEGKEDNYMINTGGSLYPTASY